MSQPNILTSQVAPGSPAARSAVHHRAPRVAILMCTYHGQHYLAEQLDSFDAQTHANWQVWVSDDGSRDDTHAILERYQQRWGGRLTVHSGPGAGFAANFLSLSCRADIDADFYAYSDQDDIWEADKLERAVSWLSSFPPEVPALYCTRTRLVDEQNRDIGFSPLFTKPASFGNALMQNLGGGNTMVFNAAARALLLSASDDIDVVTHDWWLYLLVTGCGGQVRYDAYPSLRYRQHDGNLVGMNANWSARLARIRMLWEGCFRTYNDQHMRAIERVRHRLTPDSRKRLDLVAQARQRWLLPRLIGFWRAGIYRQTLLGNIGLVVAAIFNKI